LPYFLFARQGGVGGSPKGECKHFAGEKLLPQTFVDVMPIKGPVEAKALMKELGYIKAKK
jgi:ribose transport system substrate-binding protein